MTLLYALPVRQRGPAIKQVLRSNLTAYLQRITRIARRWTARLCAISSSREPEPDAAGAGTSPLTVAATSRDRPVARAGGRAQRHARRGWRSVRARKRWTGAELRGIARAAPPGGAPNEI
jgi:hypothetical protein